MAIPKRYLPEEMETRLQAAWQAEGTYHFDRQDRTRPVYSIDTPPPTVSGRMHIGHVYSYSHADFIARYRRMRGDNVFYPLGYDDNGLPTERFVEKRLKIHAAQMARQAFTQACLEMAQEEERNYHAVLERMGLSVDWRYTYRTIDPHAQRCSQHSFMDLYRRGLAYRAQAPVIWCPECRTAIAQAELEDSPRSTEFITLPFQRVDGAESGGIKNAVSIATTRPELLAACVAVFVHPADARWQAWIGRQVRVPLYGQAVPVLADAAADPNKGSGAVMCCTFGDQTDVAWWYAHKLPLVEAIGADGRMLPAADLPGLPLAGLSVTDARRQIKERLAAEGLILSRQPTEGTIRVHERCDTPVEYRSTWQWFIRVLENKQTFLELGAQVRWHPAHMQARYQAWVENLNWDWCISRQRYFGVHFPLWYCKSCGAVILADETQLPLDPTITLPARPCGCGSIEFEPETDIMDTWATSSTSPEIVAGWLDDPDLFERIFPLTLRPQAYEIIRTWAFSSIVKAWYHFGCLPWSDALISGWAVAGEGMGKISKSKGGGPLPPMELIGRYSADALRYWAASTAPGKDQVVSEAKFEMGGRLVNKLWNVARFAEPFVREAAAYTDDVALTSMHIDPSSTPADRWLLAELDALVARVTAAFEVYEYAAAKSEMENFFWRSLADNYLEMAKQRLYDPQHPAHTGACRALSHTLKTLLQLFAPLLPFVTDAIWRELFAGAGLPASIHQSHWPQAGADRDGGDQLDAGELLAAGELLIAIATAARRYKSEHALSLSSEFARLQLAVMEEPGRDAAARQGAVAAWLREAAPDLQSVCRARVVEICAALDPSLTPLPLERPEITAAVERLPD